MPAAEAFPEDETNAPDIGRARCFVAVEALGRDVGECPGYVARGGQAVDVIDQCKTEVEQPGMNRVALLQQNVGGFDVSVHHAVLVRVGKGLEELCSNLDNLRVGELVRAQRVAKCLAGDVLVDEVDVPIVTFDRICARTVSVAQPGDRRGLALRTLGGSTLAVHDLERDVTSVLLVSRAPDRPRPASTERLDGSVAAHDQRIAGLRFRESRLCHRSAN